MLETPLPEALLTGRTRQCIVKGCIFRVTAPTKICFQHNIHTPRTGRFNSSTPNISNGPKPSEEDEATNFEDCMSKESQNPWKG